MGYDPVKVARGLPTPEDEHEEKMLKALKELAAQAAGYPTEVQERIAEWRKNMGQMSQDDLVKLIYKAAAPSISGSLTLVWRST